MSRPPIRRDSIVDALKKYGPISAAELAEVTGLTRGQINWCLNHSREAHGTKFFRISSWRRQEHGKKGNLIPVYGIGRYRPDAPRPVVNTKEERRACHARYRERNRIKLLVKGRARAGSTLASNPFAQLITVAGA